MIKYAFLAVIAAFGLTACGQGDGGQDASGGDSMAGGDMASSSDSGSNQYFEAAAKIGEVRDSGLGYKYVVIEQD